MQYHFQAMGPGRKLQKQRILFLQPILLTIFWLAPILLLAQEPQPPAQKAPTPPAAAAGYVGSEGCQSCHAEIYRTYSMTAMAQASGPATQELIPGEFRHAASGVHYRVYKENDEAWLSFERPDDPAVKGTRRLLYFIGSGHRGRTYLFAVDGFVFESPINWYGQRRVWDMAPAFQSARQIPLNLPALPGCLSCHTSNAQAPLPGTENKYALPLFAHPGITCERCHGPGAAHASTKGPIVNPAKLAPARRDAICMQCHLEGNVAIEQPGKHLTDFRPGDDLSDYVHYYLYEDQGSRELRALGQSEALAQSVCKKKSGDKMSCTSCHNPHATPSEQVRVSYYRGKCLACHAETFAAKHHTEEPDCTACHMRRTNSVDVAHTQATDHRILRVPLMPLQGLDASASAQLVRFPPESAQASPPTSEQPSTQPATAPPAPTNDIRDFALAWESLAQGGVGAALPEAYSYLQKAVAALPDDPALLSGLAFFEQQRGETEKARELYERALKVKPTLNDASSNLGVIEVKEGHAERAVQLWQEAFARSPGRSPIGMNLAIIYCGAGKFDKAREYTARVLQFNPDLPQAKALMRELSGDNPKCNAH
jgi:predicted CXXCH cytochrome family protein